MPTGIIPNTDIELNLLSGAHWSRTTIADGKWLNSNTIQPLFNNDCILASAIHDTSADLYNRLEESSGQLQNEVDKINYEIDVINAGSDVIDVVGSYQQLMEYEGWTTDNDVIKVLNDETPEHSGYQTYWRYVDPSLESGTLNPDPDKWVFLGELSPYYSKTEINEMSAYLKDYTTEASGNLFQKIDNTSAYLHQEIFDSSSYLNEYINTASGNLHNEIVNSATNLYNMIVDSATYLYDYTTNASASLFEKIDNTSSYLHTEIVNSSSYLYDYTNDASANLHQEMVTASGNLHTEIFNSSSYLHQEIFDTSSYLYGYINTASGNLHTEILTSATNLNNMIVSSATNLNNMIVTSATNLQNDIDYVSGQADYSAAYLYGLIHDTSGKTEVSGGVYVQVTKLPQKPDGMITYSADIYPDKISGFVRADIDQTSIFNGNEKSQARANIAASQVLAAPGGVNVPIDLFIQPDRSGYDISGGGYSGFIPSIPPKTATGLDRLVLGKDGSDTGSNFGWIEADLISKTLRATDGTVNSSARQHELDFELLTYRGVLWNPLQVKVHSFDEAGNETIYGELIPPTSGSNGLIKEKTIRISNESKVVFTEDPVNYLEHTQYQGDVRYHDVHLCGYYGNATEQQYGYDRTVNGDAFGVSADRGFRGYMSWAVWPMNNNQVEAGAYRKNSNPAGSVEYVNNVQDFTQNGQSYRWGKKIPTLYVHTSRNSGHNGYRVNKLIELPKDPNGQKYPKFVHGSGMFKVGNSKEIHIIPGKAPYEENGFDYLLSIDHMQNYNCSGFVANEWNHISFDFSRTSAWSVSEPSYESDLRYIAIKGRDNSDSEITVENLRLLCWY